jgi:purine-binding chemotaxis protein CheW
MTTQSTARADSVRTAVAAEQHLTFELAGELFAIPILSVQEIRSWDRVSRIPRAPDFVLGVTNLRGVMVPVMDLRRRLGIEPCEQTPTTAVIVVSIELNAASMLVGCVVDAVSDVASIDSESIRPAPPVCGSIQSHFLNGLSAIESRLVMLLDLERLIDSASMCQNSKTPQLTEPV